MNLFHFPIKRVEEGVGFLGNAVSTFWGAGLKSVSVLNIKPSFVSLV